MAIRSIGTVSLPLIIALKFLNFEDPEEYGGNRLLHAPHVHYFIFDSFLLFSYVSIFFSLFAFFFTWIISIASICIPNIFENASEWVSECESGTLGRTEMLVIHLKFIKFIYKYMYYIFGKVVEQTACYIGNLFRNNLTVSFCFGKSIKLIYGMDEYQTL